MVLGGGEVGDEGLEALVVQLQQALARRGHAGGEGLHLTTHAAPLDLEQPPLLRLRREPRLLDLACGLLFQQALRRLRAREGELLRPARLVIALHRLGADGDGALEHVLPHELDRQEEGSLHAHAVTQPVDAGPLDAAGAPLGTRLGTAVGVLVLELDVELGRGVGLEAVAALQYAVAVLVATDEQALPLPRGEAVALARVQGAARERAVHRAHLSSGHHHGDGAHEARPAAAWWAVGHAQLELARLDQRGRGLLELVEGLAEDDALRRQQGEGGLGRGGELLLVHALLGGGGLLGLRHDVAWSGLGHDQLPREGGRCRVGRGGGVVAKAVPRRKLEG
mmetsp:Transcript_37378/g.89690  ORF Transcript_37378/g.89690 Transcript_37378/m.89690 type:complete len:338 (+) Transcript_37378:269-1282(+)